MSGPGIVVQKFGGSSVADADKIRNCARKVVATAESGKQVVVVVSAMGKSTDALVALAREISDDPPPREYDMLVSAGERISMALMAMSIHALGRTGVSYTGSQAGIITDALHGKARIVDIQTARRIVPALEQGHIPIIAGFQGYAADTGEITTMGRNTSDLTAVALAAALGAELCEIYTDVEGVYTADPRIIPEARKLHVITYDEALEMAASGSRVLQTRAAELARNRKVLVHVRSSFATIDGTYIREEDERMMERAIISGVTHDTSEAKITLLAVPDRPGIAASVFRPLADEGVNVDMIVQNISHDGRTDISFTLPRTDLSNALEVMQRVAREVEASGFTHEPAVGRVSLVGAGMKTHPGVAADMFDALADAGVNIHMISTSAIRISCVVSEEQVEQAVRAAHDRFRLSEEVVFRDEHAQPATGG